MWISPTTKPGLLDALRCVLQQCAYRAERGAGGGARDISYYMADMIMNKNDPMALQAATADTMACMNFDPSMVSTAKQIAQGAAQMALSIGEHETQVTYSVLKDVIRRMAAAPGVRIVKLLASPGFITTTDSLRTG